MRRLVGGDDDLDQFIRHAYTVRRSGTALAASHRFRTTSKLAARNHLRHAAHETLAVGPSRNDRGMQHTSLLDPNSPQHIWAYTRDRLDDEMQIAYPGCRFVAERIETAEHDMVRLVREYAAGAH